MRTSLLIALGSSLANSALATNLYVSSYAATITSLKLNQKANGAFSLSQVAVNNGSAPNPSWLTKDKHNKVVYCVDEQLAGINGSLASYKTSASGELTQIDRQSVIPGPVHSVVYNGGKALALAHYGGVPAVSAWEILPSGGTQKLQEIYFLAPGENAADSHPHEALLDPTGAFIVVPDLGANLLRVFSIDNKTSLLTAATPFNVTTGGGPRHGAFLKTRSDTYFFLVTENGQTVTSYKVTYGDKQLSFSQVYESSIYGDTPKPNGATAAECYLSPCHGYLLTSTRTDNLFTIDNFDTTNSTKIPSDSLQVWKIDQKTGELAFQQMAPAGGRVPRQFSLNKNGTLAAVGLQSDSRVVIIERHVNGTLGNFVADIDIPGEITSVIFDD